MKKFLTLITVVFLSLSIYAESDVTKFLGIPVDGSKQEMIQKLKAKGFKTSPSDKEQLEGIFNGQDVIVSIVTNGDKVRRIGVSYMAGKDETQIKIAYNNLCLQFENNPKYITFGNNMLSKDEDISYNIIVNKKQYEAVYHQINPEDKFDMQYLKNMIDADSIKEIKPEEFQRLYQLYNKYQKNNVWFTITSFMGKYGILIFYDNENNNANGEDL